MDATETLKKLYLDGASLGRRRIFFVGPYGTRVSFASQQRRTLNTIWALEHDQVISPGKKVAVIGGGLAGISAAVALAARKCLVWLYDAKPRVMDLQATTTHRFIHPTVNFWPEADLRPTTEFPFFDWFGDTCASVVERLQDEWKNHFVRHLTDVYPETRVTALIERTPQNDVLVKATGTGPAEQIYDVVLVATGFGKEREVTGSMNVSYWEEDYLSERGQQGKRILVSGTGDGGLIDALRSVHLKFEKGRLCVDLATSLDATGIKQQMLELEREVSAIARIDPTGAAIRYNTGYVEVLRNTPRSALEMLDGSLRRGDPVQMIGELLPFPYSIDAAPIHKFMLTHAIQKNAITYKQAKLEDGPVIREGVTSTPVDADYCLARHGADPPLGFVLNAAEQESLKQKQRLIADYLSSVPYKHGDWNTFPNYPTDLGGMEFAMFRQPLAALYSLKSFAAPVGVTLIRGVAWYVIERSPSAKERPVSSLFGVSVKWTQRQIANAY